MKLTYKVLVQKPERLKSASGLNKLEFDALLPAFEKEYVAHTKRYTLEGKERKRAGNARKNSSFKSANDMLIFILYIYRHNPTQDFTGLHFNLTQPKVSTWTTLLEPLLQKALKKMKLTPTRDIEKLNDRLVDSVTILLDGTERAINRPTYEQEDYYSGKKNTTP